MAAAPDMLEALVVAYESTSDRTAIRLIIAAMAKARSETTETKEKA